MISRIGLLNKQSINLLSRNLSSINRSTSIIKSNQISLLSKSTTSILLKRFSSSIPTVPTSHNEEQEVLVAQRKNRPVSPHLDIYQPQLTWVMSSFHRITGIILAGAFYGLTCTFAATSLLNIPFDTNTLVSAFSSLPVAVQYGLKAIGVFPFVYHGANGIRHLIWDFGKELTLKGVYRTGYIVLATTALLGTYLTFF
ncbi:SDH3 [Candida pseudojiufengensis]|uniref:SDH3 n=1 Tax=Candida pseudojiufengensis TaxID=497109 RepID=UPI00222539C3|nr:SDH3 [Candida pseudojiufengensis]KAI5963306.1 SDH3 [Candida pseudojiufengensis]